MAPQSRHAASAAGPLTRTVAGLVIAAFVVAGCSSSSDGDSASSETTAEVVLQAPVAETDFCSQMYSIRIAALQGDGPTDRGELAAEYEKALALAPEEVQPDLEALIESLSSAAPTSTTAPDVAAQNDDGEGWQPSADPAVRVFEYVETYCAGTASNPGPAATDPE